jgi:NADPH-dependent ferric siderophore reductase
MVRVVLTGEQLEGFTSLGFDDHVKLIFPNGEGGTTQPEMRDFTPRRFDPTAGELWIDFFLHDAGPATSWAANVRVGDSLEVGGPRGSAILSPEGIDSRVFIGDETAVPAIHRALDELPAGAGALVILETDSGAAAPALSRADVETIQVSRKPTYTTPASELIETLGAIELPRERCFFWIACESQAARALRRYLREEKGIEKQWIKAAGYWQRGSAGAHQRIEDDA